MDRKIDAGSALVAAAALLLVIALFLDWFGVGGTSISAWKAFEVLDLVLLAAAGTAVAAAFGPLESRWLVAAAGVALFVVVSQLVQPPPAGQGADIEVGAWLALVAAFGLAGGAALTSAQIAVTVDVRGRERRRRVAAVDKRGTADGAPRAGAGARRETADRPTADGAEVTSPTRRAPAPTEPGADDPVRAETPDDAGADPFAPPPRDPDATQAFAVDPEAER